MKDIVVKNRKNIYNIQAIYFTFWISSLKILSLWNTNMSMKSNIYFMDYYWYDILLTYLTS